MDIKCFHDNSQEIERIYSVYYISYDDKRYVLKKTLKEEIDLYTNYLNKNQFIIHSTEKETIDKYIRMKVLDKKALK